MSSRNASGSAAATLGILWMLAATLGLVTTDALAKILAASYSPFEILWIRYVAQVAVLALMSAREFRKLASTRRLGLQLLRGVLLVAQISLFYTGLRYLPLAEATVILFLAPLIVAALSTVFLGERVRLSHWLAILAGFAGVLTILRPGGAAFQSAALLPLGAACLFAAYQVVTRILGQTEDDRTTLLFTFVSGTAVTSVAVPFVWVSPPLGDWPLLLATAATSALGHYFLIKAFKNAPASVVAPFGYTALIWAAVFGYVLFGERLDQWTLLGGGIIMASGLYVTRSLAANR